MSDVRAPATRIAQRIAWSALALFLLAFVVLEVINHGVAAAIAAFLFLIIPDLTVPIGARTALGNGKPTPRAVSAYYNLLHRPWIPLIILIAYSTGVLGDWVPLFTAPLGWLTHIALHRAVSPPPQEQPHVVRD